MAGLMRRLAPQLVALAALVGLVTAFYPAFLDLSFGGGRLSGPLVDVLKRAAPVALLATGMTLVIATRGIDLSVGAIMAICGAVAATAITAGWGLPAALLLALGAGAAAGLWNGVLVAVLGIQPFVATLILMTMGRGIAQLITEGRIMTFTDAGFAWIGSGTALGLPVPAWLWIATAAAFALVLRRTALGMLVEATGINRRASGLAGVNATVLLVAVYVAAGLCAALAGLVVTADIRGADANNAGLWLELDAILAVVIGGNSLLGGRFSIAASVIGALIIQTITIGIRLAGFPSEYNLIIKAVLVLVILVLQSPRLAPEWQFWRDSLRAARNRPADGKGAAK
ncbi:monosaccharide ABC transporter membrane protein, CUT2 family [Paracoccus thiocyanatus]|uniref:Monosaccharide ABC transporter membrane protein, CUT2 family n=1 Tax=Paracoccus thiocyanatus TaxID=34006 RepID=A0A1N6U616_9RHOB|nr:ABC transporter permease [Paracoccus thiocyanatus]SIQ61098.1 monosaccharide ABC transporter membrane protein, CUT2 family [Paracoccus thiocyanatus]